MGQIQSLFGYGNQHVSADCYPNLRPHRVLAGAVEHFDAQMLLDPLEEQLHLPALAIQVGNQCGFENEVVRQKNDAFACFVLDNDTAQQCRIVLAGVKQRQYTRLIAHDIRLDLVHRVGISALELCIALGASDKERVGLMNYKQALEIQITAIQQIERKVLTSWVLPSVIWMKVGILPLKSSKVCSRTAALACRNGAQGKTDRHRSMVVASNA
jgi:hypothetical protein